MSNPIPKFASFKPKVKAQDAVTNEINESQKSVHPSAQGSNFRSRADDKKRAIASRDQDFKYRKRQRVEFVEKEEEDVFTIDEKGDSKNLTYESLHKYDVPRYYRQGYGRVIGNRDSGRIDKTASTLTEIVLILNDEQSHSISSHPLRDTAKRSEENDSVLIKADTGSWAECGELDYLSVEQSEDHKTNTADTSDNESSLNFICHASVRTTDNCEKTTDLIQEAGAQDGSLAARRENATWTRRTEACPSDILAWEALIRHQSEMIDPGVDPSMFTRRQRITLAELRLSLYNKAIEYCGSEKKEGLILAMLTEGSHIWNERTKDRKWNEALSANPMLPELWMRYCDIFQTAEHGFNYEDTKAKFHTCLEKIDKATRKLEKSQVSIAKIHLLIRYTRFVHECGYTELAIAIWLALFQLHLVSQLKDMTFREKLQTLESSWDCEMPYFGGSTAVKSENTGPGVGKSPEVDLADSPFAQFAIRENDLHHKYRTPGTPTMDDNEDDVIDDAFHLLLFSDMKDLLPLCDIEADELSWIDAFFAFFDLPRLSDSCAKGRLPWRRDPFLATPKQYQFPRNQVNYAKSDIYDGSQTLLKSESCFPNELKIEKSTLELLNNAIPQLVDHYPLIKELPGFLLSFQCCYFPAEAPKTAKRLIKASQTDFSLYNLAALVEVKQGRVSKAIKIWQTALGLASSISLSAATSTSLTKQRRHDLMLLAHDWASTEFQNGDEQLALKRLASYDTRYEANSNLTSSTRLSLERDFSAGLDDALVSSNPTQFLLYASSRCLLTYLTSPPETQLSSTFHLLEELSLLPQLSSNKSVQNNQANYLERLHALKSRYISHHISRKKRYRPAELIESISTSLRLFPSSRLLLQTWTLLTKGSNILESRLRNISTSKPWVELNDSSPLENWMFTIQGESERWVAMEYNAGIEEGIRSLFTRALTSEISIVRHVFDLWDMWLGFEMQVLTNLSQQLGDKKRKNGVVDKRIHKQWEKVKSVYYSGMSKLPWCRKWILRGLEIFDDKSNMQIEQGQSRNKELQALYRELLKRDMRIRIEIDDKLLN